MLLDRNIKYPEIRQLAKVSEPSSSDPAIWILAIEAILGIYSFFWYGSQIGIVIAILTGARWCIRIVLICISLMAKDVEHFVKCLSATLDSSNENCLFSSVPHFVIGLFGD
ncbi:zinc finger protein [Cricetulus griseus]|nr:zinc finger protein [Cricetulus griseus]